MQKRWYSEVCEREDHEKKKLLTVVRNNINFISSVVV